jgi:hypothetical protein
MNKMLGWKTRGSVALIVSCLGASVGCSDSATSPADAAVATDSGGGGTDSGGGGTDSGGGGTDSGGGGTDSGVRPDSGGGTVDAAADVPATQDAGAGARVRVIHAAPGAPNVDIYAAGATAAAVSNVAYGSATAYLTLPAGNIAFDIRAAGQTGAPAFTTPQLTLAAGRSYTVIAAGRLGSMDAADRFRVLALTENFEADTARARVRVVHAGSDAPTVGIDVGNNDPSMAEVPSLARFADTGEGGVPLPGDAALQVGLVTGTPAARVTAFTTPNLGAGNQWFVIATGLLPSTDTAVNNGFGLLAVNQNGTAAFIKQNPRVHVVHAGADAPAVDLFAGPAGAGGNPARTVQIVDNLAYPVRNGATTTGGIASAQVPPGSYGIDIFPYSAGSARPSGNPAFTVPTLELAPGRQYVAIAAYFLNPPSGATPPASGFAVLPLAYEITNDGTTATAPRIVAVHAAGNAPNVDIGVVAGSNFTTLFGNVARGASSAAAGTTAPLDPITVGIRPAGTTSVAASFAVDLDVNQKVFVIAAGALSPRAATGGGLADQAFGLHAVFANPGTVQLGAGAWTLARINPIAQ